MWQAVGWQVVGQHAVGPQAVGPQEVGPQAVDTQVDIRQLSDIFQAVISRLMGSNEVLIVIFGNFQLIFRISTEKLLRQKLCMEFGHIFLFYNHILPVFFPLLAVTLQQKHLV